ncbi:hypothetical protein [Metabacillus sp. Hm71]|uniref:hypothetical protein n=1 Tax=Metabacillus sp. Hm71 TaxID=3450743 RepID=UPI003F42E587
MKTQTKVFPEFNVVINESLKSIELHFKKEISQKVATYLEGQGFKLLASKNLWFSRYTPVDHIFIEDLRKQIA